MENVLHGGPAFPSDHEFRPAHDGMSLRDYFAGQALVGLVLKCEQAGDAAGAAPGISEDAYKLADAMLIAREAE